MAMWKTNHLSFAGRLTLAKSVLEAVPIYSMMSTKIPRTCLEKIQKIQRNFIWGDSDQKRRWHAVAWEVVTLPKRMGGLGLRDLKSMNKACLLKLGWKVASNSTDYCCRVIREKYGRIGDTQNLIKKATDSALWKNLVDLQPVLDQFSYWFVGDGATIDAWHHAWIEPDLVVAYVAQVPETLVGIKVKELTTETGTWNWKLMEEWLPVEILNKIAVKLPPHADNGADVHLFTGNNALDCTVSGMYNHIRGFANISFKDVWSVVWKLNVPERVRCFTWLVMHGRILTNMTKKMMGMGHGMCHYCGNVEETLVHVLRDCPLASNVWHQIVPSAKRCRFFMLEAEGWIHNNLTNKERWKGGSFWNDIWATVCHCVWTWRNKEIHVANYVRPPNPVSLIITLLKDYEQAVLANRKVMMPDRVLKLIRWIPPILNTVKMNTDGACKQNTSAGCGGVIRGSQGEWLGGFARRIGRCSVMEAELWGVLEGINLAWRMGFKDVEVNVDSTTVVNAIKLGKINLPSGCVLLNQIRRMLSRNWKIDIISCYREANRCADALASWGCSLDMELTFFDDCPDLIREIYDSDVRGIAAPRMITV